MQSGEIGKRTDGLCTCAGRRPKGLRSSSLLIAADSSFEVLFAVENAQADAPTDGIGTAS